MTKCILILDHNRLARENVECVKRKYVKKKHTHRKQFRNQIETVWSFRFFFVAASNVMRAVEVAKDRHYYHRSLSIISNIRLVDAEHRSESWYAMAHIFVYKRDL